MADSDPQADSAAKAAATYQVIARRYRPQAFDELIGQEHVAKALGQAISTGRVGHAYLFTGARGVGKTSAARVLAKALNCVEGPTVTPCNQCEVCDGIASGDDVDTIEIDAASNTGVDNIRDLRQNAGVKASRCRYKIYIIDEVHMLSKSAFNALLKTLEEPPDHVKFIFATTEPEKIPITILSRCQRFDFAGIDATSIANRLQQIAATEEVTIDDEALAVLSIRAAGSMRDSQSLLEQLLAVAGKQITATDVYTLLGIAPGERVAQLVATIVDRDPAAALGHLDDAVSGGSDVGQVIDQLLGYFRDVMAMTVGCDTSQLRYVLPGQYELTKTMGDRLGVHTVLAMIQVLDQTASRMRGSLHTRTLAEMALVRLANLDDLDNLAEVAAELRAGDTSSESPSSAKKNASQPQTLPSTSPASKAPVPPTATNALTADNGTPQRVDTPASSTPPAPMKLDAAKVNAAWDRVIDALDEGLLQGYARNAIGIQLSSDGNIVVAYPPGDRVSKDMCANATNTATLTQALSAELGTQVTLRFDIDQSAGSDAPTAVAQPRVASRRQMQAEIAERPFVARAMELFGADPSKLRITPPRNDSSS